ncbi:hypothetical protein L3Q82_019116 [Scortum barcoo]|uniref:Uncharacterized protein n=1 Tax=Scortum barcoo TaxID=214431 RepID=A0ACB8VGM1_9TELE|nr:hypothetical protein L3Q82_019116 [Scortum barcoo]
MEQGAESLKGKSLKTLDSVVFDEEEQSITATKSSAKKGKKTATERGKTACQQYQHYQQKYWITDRLSSRWFYKDSSHCGQVTASTHQNLNISYPEAQGATVEFLQRCLFKINPDKGSKVENTPKKQLAVSPKVLTLTKNADYEWRD